MQAHIIAVTKPQFLLIRCKPDAVAGIAMPSYWPCGPSLHFYPCKFFAGFDISHFKTKQAIHRYIGPGFLAINSKWADKIPERPYLTYNFIFFGISYF